MHSAVCNAHMRLPSQAHGGTGCYGGIQSSCSRRAAMGCRGSSSSSSSPTSSLWFLRGAVEGTWASRPAIIHAPSTSRDWLTCSHLLCLLCRCQGVATYQITYRKCACSLSGLANNSTSPKHSPTPPPLFRTCAQTRPPSLMSLSSPKEASFSCGSLRERRQRTWRVSRRRVRLSRCGGAGLSGISGRCLPVSGSRPRARRRFAWKCSLRD